LATRVLGVRLVRWSSGLSFAYGQDVYRIESTFGLGTFVCYVQLTAMCKTVRAASLAAVLGPSRFWHGGCGDQSFGLHNVLMCFLREEKKKIIQIKAKLNVIGCSNGTRCFSCPSPWRELGACVLLAIYSGRWF